MGYKTFEHGFKCRGFQYEENKVFETERAEMCVKGFHYCDNPLDTLKYKELIDNNGDIAEFAEVEPLEEPIVKGNKCCTRKIKIGAKLKFGDFIRASIEFLLNKTENKEHENYLNLSSSEHNSQLASSGDFSQLASSGSGSQLASSGDFSQLASSGSGSQLVSSGDFSQLASSGSGSQLVSSGDNSQLVSSGYGSQLLSSSDYSHLASSGDFSQLASSGNYSQLVSNGYGSQLASSGDFSQLASSGSGSQLVSSGDNCVVANIGAKGKAKAKKGSFIVLAEYNGMTPINVRATKVDGEIIKEDTWYELIDGEFREV